MNIVFFGNSKYSVIGADIIHQSIPISLVITTEDKPTGRDKTLTPSPVKTWALKNKVPFLETNKLTPGFILEIKKINPDFLIVEDYGLILPQELLDVPQYASLNIHHSLLPKYRGPSPAPTTILSGDKKTGVTIIEMTQKVDAGQILDQVEYNLDEKETTDTLLSKLNTLGAELIPSVIERYLNQTQKKSPQNESQATLTIKFSKEDSKIDLNNLPDPEILDRMIRAYYPWPIVWTIYKEKIVKFLPGGLVQMEGKKAVPLKDFLNGYPDFPLKQLQ